MNEGHVSHLVVEFALELLGRRLEPRILQARVDEAQEHLFLLLLLEARVIEGVGGVGVRVKVKVETVTDFTRHIVADTLPAVNMGHSCWRTNRTVLLCQNGFFLARRAVDPEGISYSSWPPCLTKIFIRSSPSASGSWTHASRSHQSQERMPLPAAAARACCNKDKACTSSRGMNPPTLSSCSLLSFLADFLRSDSSRWAWISDRRSAGGEAFDGISSRDKTCVGLADASPFKNQGWDPPLGSFTFLLEPGRSEPAAASQPGGIASCPPRNSVGTLHWPRQPSLGRFLESKVV